MGLAGLWPLLYPKLTVVQRRSPFFLAMKTHLILGGEDRDGSGYFVDGGTIHGNHYGIGDRIGQGELEEQKGSKRLIPFIF